MTCALITLKNMNNTHFIWWIKIKNTNFTSEFITFIHY